MTEDNGTMEITRLETLERLIEKKLKSFLEVGAALMEIREEKLYRAQYPTFETYCAERWGFTSVRARQLMLAVKVDAGVSVDLPSEAVARALHRYPEPLHETIVLIAKAQADLLGKSITSSMITSIGDVLTQAAVTGAVSLDGETSALDAVLTEEAYEVLQRQRQHIAESMSLKVEAVWKGTAHIEGGAIILDAAPGTLDTFPSEFKVTIWPLVRNAEEA